MGTNFSMGKIVGGEDEDGETIFEWSTDRALFLLWMSTDRCR